MKKILIQLDSDKFPSTFDSIVAHDAGADVVQSYGGISPADVRGLVLGAVYTRGIPDLKSIAVWIGGSDVEAGEQILEEARHAFFGPFKVSLMLDSNGCNTTACTAIAKLARQTELHGKDALVIGPGPIGIRTAVLLAGEGCRVYLTSIPSELLEPRFNRELAERTLESAWREAERFRNSSAVRSGGILDIGEASEVRDLEPLLDKAEILIGAGPAGFRLLSFDSWSRRSRLKWLLDFNLTEPSGIEGIKPGDDFAEYDGKRALGALAIGNSKMNLHRACIARLFERNDLILDADEMYKIAKQL